MAKDKSAKNPLEKAKKAKKSDKDNGSIKKKRTVSDPSAGDQFKFADHLGELVLIDVKDIVKELATSNGVVDVIEADVVVLTKPNKSKLLDEPQEFTGSYLFGQVIFNSLKSKVGTDELVLARIGQGVAKKGNNAPWTLEAANSEERKLAEAYLG